MFQKKPGGRGSSQAEILNRKLSEKERLVYALYGLTKKETAVVEKGG